MSQANIELARRAIQLGNAGRFYAAAELDHPDVEARDLQPAPGTPEVMRGRDAIVKVWKQWLEVFDEWHLEVHRYLDADPWVISDVQWYATGKGSDVRIDWREVEAHEFRDGLIVRAVYNYPDVAAALEAVGAGATSEASP